MESYESPSCCLLTMAAETTFLLHSSTGGSNEVYDTRTGYGEAGNDVWS